MAAKLISAVCCTLSILSASCYGDASTRENYTPVQYLKNYALSSCIAEGYQSKEVANDAVAAANGYKELGSLDIDAYNEVAALAPKFLSKSYMSQSGELDRVARKYATRK